MSNGVGGDLYDFFPCDRGRYSLVIGDVIGHELFSALVMWLVVGAVRAAGPTANSPIDVLSLVNTLLCDLNDELQSTVLTCSLFLGTVDPQRRWMAYANAGHPAPLAWRLGGAIHEMHSARVPILGVDRDFMGAEHRLDLNDVDRLLLYTDGLSEARDRSGSFFDEEGIVDAVSSCKHLGVDAAADCVLDRVVEFADGRPSDDVTFVLAEFACDRMHEREFWTASTTS
jgi:sigma-B regulation protein RsbU (phosphoserine phosphatase)